MKFTKTLKNMALAAALTAGFAGFNSNASASVVDVLKSAIGQPASANIPPANLLLTYFNRDMGTVYNFNNVGDTYTYGVGGANDIDNAANLAGGATTTSGSESSNATAAHVIDGHVEDTWGVAYVSNIDVADDGSVDWASGADTGVGAEYITIMFYGGYDISTTLLPGGTQETQSANVHMDVYVSSTNPTPGGVLGANGSSDRTGDSTYNGITGGTLILSLLSDSFKTLFNPASSTSGSAGYFSVTGGTLGAAFDSNTYGGSDLLVQFTTVPRTTVGLNDWLVSSNDPARAFVIPLPGAASMGFGLMGLVAIARKRRVA